MKMVNTKNLQICGNICAEVRINLGKTLLRCLIRQRQACLLDYFKPLTAKTVYHYDLHT